MFPLTVMLLFPPNRSMAAELVEPMLVLPVMVLSLTARKSIESADPPTNSLLETVMLLSY